MELEVGIVISVIILLYFYFTKKSKKTRTEPHGEEAITVPHGEEIIIEQHGEETTAEQNSEDSNFDPPLPDCLPPKKLILSSGYGALYSNLLVDEYGDLYGSGVVVGQHQEDETFVSVPFEHRAAQIILGQLRDYFGQPTDENILILDVEGGVWGKGKFGDRTYAKFTRIPFQFAVKNITVERKITFLAANSKTAVAIDENNRLWQIRSSRDNSKEPFIIPNIPRVRSAACGEYGILLELCDGDLIFYRKGRLNLINLSNRDYKPRGELRCIAASCSKFCVVDENGVVWKTSMQPWDRCCESFCPNGLSNCSSVAGDGDFFIALDCEGKVWVWGNTTKRYFERLQAHKPTLIPSLPPMRAISVGAQHCMGITMDGRYMEMRLFCEEAAELSFLPPPIEEDSASFSTKTPVKNARFV